MRILLSMVLYYIRVPYFRKLGILDQCQAVIILRTIHRDITKRLALHDLGSCY